MSVFWAAERCKIPPKKSNPVTMKEVVLQWYFTTGTTQKKLKEFGWKMLQSIVCFHQAILGFSCFKSSPFFFALHTKRFCIRSSFLLAGSRSEIRELKPWPMKRWVNGTGLARFPSSSLGRWVVGFSFCWWMVDIGLKQQINDFKDTKGIVIYKVW